MNVLQNLPNVFLARTRRGFHRAPRRVILGDGAPWIWNLADEFFPGSVQIVDRFHAKEHLRSPRSGR